ncbi:MAG: purine-nucleoside phosphorylase [Solobacterium sp.]|nr:purine-nucleoside phosphorylase [Solobacterium sp.]
MATPHISAKDGQFAKTVLMPGDPLRAQFIAENFLEGAQLVTSVRNVYGYTGMYKGKPVSVMASGMGMPSIGIYSYELYKFYDVETIIRIGSAGSYVPELRIYDVVLATGAYSESSYALTQSGEPVDSILYPDPEVNARIKATAKQLGIPLHEGIIHSSDVFYRQNKDYLDDVRDNKHCVAVEMESFSLFHNANVLGKKAACLLTISDSFVSPEITTHEERRKSFTNMMEIALEAAE